MEVIRKGNDLEILWTIYTGEGEERIPYDLTGRDVSFFLVSAYGRQRKEDIVTEGNVLRWMFRGKDQKESVYSLELVINDGQDGMRSVDICDAFRLVGKCCDVHSHPTEGVELQYMQFSSTWGTEYIEVVDRLDSNNSNAALSARQGKIVNDKVEGLSDVARSGAYADLKDKPSFAKVNGQRIDQGGEIEIEVPDAVAVVDGLASSDKSSALSANQGKVLKEMIEGLAEVAKTGSYDDLTDAPEFATVNGKRIDQGGDIQIESSAKVEVDTELSETSENAIANSTVSRALAEKQDLLMDGINIKTVNGQNILGGGNIEIEGGGGGSDVDLYPTEYSDEFNDDFTS
jgi:hypothetical protein